MAEADADLREKSELTLLAKRKGYTVDGLAAATEISRVTIWRHASGERSPSIADREKYSAALGLSMAEVNAIFDRALDGIERTPDEWARLLSRFANRISKNDQIASLDAMQNHEVVKLQRLIKEFFESPKPAKAKKAG